MRTIALLILLLSTSQSLANDSVAELKSGGLVLARSDEVSILREDLFVSMKEIRVSYQFLNKSGQDIETIVAFPMPDVTGSRYESIAFPGEVKDNFLGFTVEVDGVAVTPNLQQRAWAGGLDVTGLLVDAGVPLLPDREHAGAVLQSLSAEVIAGFTDHGIVAVDSYDAGKGMQHDIVPVWTLKSAYWWKMRFPAGQPVEVSHRYRPGVGGAAGLNFVSPDGRPGHAFDAYEQKYCISEGFFPAASRRVVKAGKSGGGYYENWLSYILTTGANWAGPIGTFHLTVDKGSPGNLVAFCGTGVKKTGPTQFEMTLTDFVPQRDLDVLFMISAEQE